MQCEHEQPQQQLLRPSSATNTQRASSSRTELLDTRPVTLMRVHDHTMNEYRQRTERRLAASPSDRLSCIFMKNFHLTLTAFLHYIVKLENYKQMRHISTASPTAILRHFRTNYTKTKKPRKGADGHRRQHARLRQFSEVQKPRDLDVDLGSGAHSTYRTTNWHNRVTVVSRSTKIRPFDFRDISTFREV